MDVKKRYSGKGCTAFNCAKFRVPHEVTLRTSHRSGQPFAPFLPVFAGEDLRSDLDEPRQHLEHRNRCPAHTLAGAVSAAVELFGDRGVGTVLHSELHHQLQDLLLRRILFQMLSIRRDLQAKRNFFGALRLVGAIALPFDRDQSPALFNVPGDVVGSKRCGYFLANAFLCHPVTPKWRPSAEALGYHLSSRVARLDLQTARLSTKPRSLAKTFRRRNNAAAPRLVRVAAMQAAGLRPRLTQIAPLRGSNPVPHCSRSVLIGSSRAAR